MESLDLFHDQLAAAILLADRLYVGVKVTRRQLFLRQLRVARISPEELRAKLSAGDPVFIVDLRHDLDVQLQPVMIRGAVRIDPAALKQGHATIPRERETVLYCSWPNEATSARVALLLRKRGVS